MPSFNPTLNKPMKKAITTLRTTPSRLLWWQWAKLAGLVAPPLALLSGSHLAVVLAAHLCADFSLQNDWMSDGKGKRQIIPLLVHSIIAGGGPGLVAGGIVGAAIGFASHLLIDRTRQFGLPSPWGYVIDQAAHVLILVGIVIL